MLVTLYQPLRESMRMGTMKLSMQQVKAARSDGDLVRHTSLATVDTDTFEATGTPAVSEISLNISSYSGQ